MNSSIVIIILILMVIVMGFVIFELNQSLNVLDGLIVKRAKQHKAVTGMLRAIADGDPFLSESSRKIIKDLLDGNDIK